MKDLAKQRRERECVAPFKDKIFTERKERNDKTELSFSFLPCNYSAEEREEENERDGSESRLLQALQGRFILLLIQRGS